MTEETLAKYRLLFSRLNRKVSREHGRAPHKPILLLALLDEIERGAFPENRIVPTPELVAAFRSYWNALVTTAHWQPRMDHPFRYMHHEGFWTFLKDGIPSQPADKPYSLLQLRSEFDAIQLAPDLWQLLQDRVALRALRSYLLESDFGRQESALYREASEGLLNYEAERLKSEAQSKFCRRWIRESKSDGYFVRHSLFPRVIRKLYEESCAVCGLAVHTDTGRSIVDGAHIMPFAEFHNDDPRNGISLCKNHHWGYDAGWFSLNQEYRVVVSPRLRSGEGYVTAGVKIQLPQDPGYYPALEALAWHEKTRLLR